MASKDAVDGSGTVLIVVIHPSVSPFGLTPQPAIVSPLSEIARASLSVQPATWVASPLATNTSSSEYIVPSSQMNASGPAVLVLEPTTTPLLVTP
jgi:hypothetical protein